MKNFTQKILGFLAFISLGTIGFAQTTIFSEDFDGSLPSDWTAVEVVGNMMTASNWIWTNTGASGPVASVIPDLMSTSASNGWMIFDSDLNCSGAQDVWLVTPSINCSSNNIVILEFENLYREFNSLVRIQVSTDSTVWTQFPLFPNIGNTQFGDGSSAAASAINPQSVSVDISSVAANEPSIWVAFEFLADSSTVEAGTDIGCGYAWQIDDVTIYEPAPGATDISIVNFFYPPLSFRTPSSQIATDTMGFSADITNNGPNVATNVVLKAEVTNASGALLFADSVIFDEIAVGIPDTTMVVPTIYPPSNALGVYTIKYTLYSLDLIDTDMNNNSFSETYEVTEDLWAKEAAATIAYRPGGGPTNYDIGNMYWTSDDWVETYYATTVNFTAATNAGDGPLSNFMTTIILLEVDEDEILPSWDNFETADNYIVNEGLTIRSFELHQYAGANFAMQTVNLNDFDEETPGVQLKPGNRYILIASYENENNVVFHGFSEEISYINQVSTVIYNDQWFLGGFGPEQAAVLRMRLSIDVAVEDVLPAGVMSVYPNPVMDQLNLDLAFDQPELVNVTIANLDGRVIQTDIVKNALQESKQYNVSSLPAGTYLIRVTTEEGSRTEKFVVVK